MKSQIEKIVYPGKSLTRIDNKIVFTNEGLPGETLDITLIKDAGNYSLATTNKIITASKHRVKAKCDHYKICSPYQYIDYDYQLEIKKNQLLEILKHALDNKDMNIELRPAKNIWGYRNKAEFKIIWLKEKAYCAYHNLQSTNSFQSLSECFLLPEAINKTIKIILDLISQNQLNFIEEITLRRSSSQEKILLILKISSPKDIMKLSPALLPLTKEEDIIGTSCRYLEKNKNKNFLLWGKDYLEETIADLSFKFSGNCFFQVNIELLKTMLIDIKTNLEFNDQTILADLYSGVGTFGLSLAKKIKQLLLVESEAENILFLKQNISFNKITNALIYEGFSQDWIDKIIKAKVDILIIDPPRKGLDPYLCKQLTNSPIKNIIYISCNPTTLARDLKLLKSAYKINQIFLYDFFPHTHHLETMVILSHIIGGS